ncbi:MAG: penicillin-binding protein activator LpoB [Planctomycetota bacterium]
MESVARSLVFPCILCLLAASCRTPEGRVMEDSEQDYVGARAAGAETFERLIAGTVNKLLEGQTAARTATGRLSIAVLPVENASGEELGDWQEQIYDLIATSINTSDRYQMINRRFVEAALREGRLRSTELFLPEKRREFLRILEVSKSPADFLLFPKLTSGTTQGEGVRQRNYLLTLDLVDVHTGAFQSVAEKVRKAYTR